MRNGITRRPAAQILKMQSENIPTKTSNLSNSLPVGNVSFFCPLLAYLPPELHTQEMPKFFEKFGCIFLCSPEEKKCEKKNLGYFLSDRFSFVSSKRRSLDWSSSSSCKFRCVITARNFSPRPDRKNVGTIYQGKVQGTTYGMHARGGDDRPCTSSSNRDKCSSYSCCTVHQGICSKHLFK